MPYDSREDNDCSACGARGAMFRSSYCGVLVCDACDSHRGLVRCYCGWAESGGDGYEELEEMGETIDAEY